jgi:rubrerythrin
MATFFNAADVAEAAINIEKMGQVFYSKAAQNASNDEARSFFEGFVTEEQKHQKVFEDLQQRLGGVELPAWSSSDEYMEYLKALVENHGIFSSELSEKEMAASKDIKEAVRKAMSFEKDSILFFMEMKELVPDSEKGLIQECIEEERSHLRMLADMLS